MSMTLAKLEEALTAFDQRVKHETLTSMMAKHIEGSAVANVTQTLSVADSPGLSSATLQYTDTQIILTLTPA